MPTILITGANRGIGLNLARLYAADDWKVIGTARKPADAAALAALPGNISVEALEVTDHAAMQALAAKLKGEAIDVLWNNAGVIGRNSATLGQIDADELRETLMINTYAPILIAEAFRANVVASAVSVGYVGDPPASRVARVDSYGADSFTQQRPVSSRVRRAPNASLSGAGGGMNRPTWSTTSGQGSASS